MPRCGYPTRYNYARRVWERVAASTKSEGRKLSRPTWMQIASRRKKEFLQKGVESSGNFDVAPPFLLLSEENARSDANGGGRVVFRCRSHMSTENYRCAASWVFDVAKTAGGRYDVAVSSSDPNGHEANDTPEYRDTRESAMTRHYSDAAMDMGDSACTASRVGELVASKGELWRT